MKTSPYVAVSGTMFGVMAIAHIVRLMFGWPVRVADQAIPVWFSAVGLVLAGALCLWALRVLSSSGRDAD
jgi:hypothetical protein